MNPSLTDTLCTRCGLCCDGSLFADVELAGPAEAVGLEVMGLEIEDDDAGGGLLLQPCAALRGKRCGIYAHRPECCRTFECGLLRDVGRGTVDVKRAEELIAEARRRVGRVRELAAELGQRDGRLPLKERYAEALALADEAAANPALNRIRTELQAEMSATERLIRKRFLGGGARGGIQRTPG
jgi:Fe-S-cluster containining protein